MTATQAAIILVELRMKPRGKTKTKRHETPSSKCSLFRSIINRLQIFQKS